MNQRPAFTIIELLISITLSSFIMIGMVQLYQGVVRYLETTRDMMSTDREVCLLFNQLERDLTSAYIPNLAKEAKEVKEGKTPQAQTPDQKKKEEELDKERRNSFFIGQINEQADSVKIDNKRIDLCKSMSFISSNPLQVYGEKKTRLVRVIYEVVVDKAQSTRELISYQIIRKETDDLLNVRGKVDEFAPPAPGKAVRSYVVADDVKGFYIEYVTKKKEEKGKESKDKPAEEKELRSFKWGDKEEVQGVVPQKILVWIDFWNDKQTKSFRFATMIPVMSYPTEKEEKKDGDKDKDKDKKQQDGQQQPPADGAASAVPGATPSAPATSGAST